MTDNDRRIICSAYLDNALDDEEKQWFEEELLPHPVVQEQIETLRQLKNTLSTYSPPKMPHTPEVCWQKFKAQKRVMQSPIPKFWFWTPAAICVALFIGIALKKQKNATPSASAVAEYKAADVAVAARAEPEPAVRVESVTATADDLSVSTFQADGASVIWIAGLPWREGWEPLQ